MSTQTVENRHRVVVIGSGFGGLFGTKHLERADVDVTLISKTSTHLFQPLLYQVATGILSTGEIAPATRLVLRKQKNAQVLLGEVTRLDLQNKTVTSRLLDQDTVTPFDSLIVATGAQQSYFGNDRFATYAPGMKTIDDALELRGRILGAFEQAELATTQEQRDRLLTFVIVGAAPRASSWPGRSPNSPTARWRALSTISIRAMRASCCSRARAPYSDRWGPSSAARPNGGWRRWASRSSSTPW